MYPIEKIKNDLVVNDESITAPLLRTLEGDYCLLLNVKEKKIPELEQEQEKLQEMLLKLFKFCAARANKEELDFYCSGFFPDKRWHPGRADLLGSIFALQVDKRDFAGFYNLFKIACERYLDHEPARAKIIDSAASLAEYCSAADRENLSQEITPGVETAINILTVAADSCLPKSLEKAQYERRRETIKSERKSSFLLGVSQQLKTLTELVGGSLSAQTARFCKDANPPTN